MNIFTVDPYKGVGPFHFGMTEDHLTALGLRPLRRTMNPRKEPDLDFGAYSMRFGAKDGQLCEIGFSKQSVVKLDEISVFSDPDALERILMKDSNIFEFYGFLVFLGLGVTLTGFHDGSDSDKAMTVFGRGRWDSMLANPKFRKWG